MPEWTCNLDDDVRAAAATLGRRGGQARTPAQQEARRANGRQGGRRTGSETLPVWVDGEDTGRRSATAAGARLAARRAGWVLPHGARVRLERGRWVLTRDARGVYRAGHA